MKQTRKQIEANLRNKMAKRYNDKLSNLQERLTKVTQELYDTRKRMHEAEAKAEELEEQNRQYKDWIERLQEFCNMSEEDRNKEIEKMKAEQKFKTYIANSPFFKNLGNFASIMDF